MNEPKQIYQLNLDQQQMSMVINALSLAAASQSEDVQHIFKALKCFISSYNRDKYNALMNNFLEMSKTDEYFSKHMSTNIKL